MSIHKRQCWWFAAVLLSLGGAAQAQQARQVVAFEGYVVSGTIVARDGTPISEADVDVMVGDSALKTVRSDANGRFRLEQMASTPVTLRVRRVGFQSKDLSVEVPSPDRTVTIEIRLDAAAANLDTVTVSADATTAALDPRLAEFRARRQKSSFAHFLDAAMIAASHPAFLSDALRRIPGVVVRPSSRSGNVVRMRSCSSGPSSGDRGAPLLWIDGVRIPAAEVDEMVRAADVAGVEIYSSLAGVPAAYLDRSASCGTILVWTKSGR